MHRWVMYLIRCSGLSQFLNIFSWEFWVNDLRCWCPSNVWLHCKEWCHGQGGSPADIPPLSLTHGCRHLGAIGAGQVFLLSQTVLLCYQPYQLPARLRVKEAQNCRYNWPMMRKLMGKFYFLITRIIKSAETRSFWRNFKIYTQYSQIF